VISKSKFIQGWYCTKRFYLEQVHPELKSEEPDQAHFEDMIRIRNEVSMLARQLFPEGVAAVQEPYDADALAANAIRTTHLLKGEQVLFDATFIFDDLSCSCDVIKRSGDGWMIYSIKAVTNIREKHIRDLAFQYAVLQRCGYTIHDTQIIDLNSDYRLDAELKVQQLFSFTSVLKKVKAIQPELESTLQNLQSVIQSAEEPSVSMGSHCKLPYPCLFAQYCNSQLTLEENPVDSKDSYFHKKEITTFLHGVRYPLHFFDFESVQYAVPVFQYTSPFQQIPFQYSLHQLAEGDPLIQHHSYLGNGVDDPRPELIVNMLDLLGEQGSIIVWSQSFEAACIRDLAAFSPAHRQSLLRLLDRLVDLMDPFKKKWIAVPEALGKISLKAVLPGLLNDQSYSSLDIRDGTRASNVYANLRFQNVETRVAQRQQLLDYCHTDTIAMYRIWMKLNEMAGY
jgi:predicted RecB family nuclease